MIFSFRNSCLLLAFLVFLGCSSDSADSPDSMVVPEVNPPTPFSLELPELFEQNILAPVIPSNNPLTEEGVALGKKLFFDPTLSSDNSVSCSSCHNPVSSFSDNARFSTGVNNRSGSRNSMSLFNLAWNFDERFFWDGRALSLEDQAFKPVVNPDEMGNTWNNVVNTLQANEEYRQMFRDAFGTENIDSVKVVRAIAQFERTLISGNSRFDRSLRGEISLTEEESRGLNVFMSETKGDCFHCHGNPNNPLWTDNIFHNNGLDATFEDLGLGLVTGDPADNGKFKTPSLRNLEFTAPYMHDGRFETLDQVIDFYSEGLQNSPTIDPLMKKVAQGGVQLSDQEKADLKAFLLSLSDPDFAENTDF